MRKLKWWQWLGGLLVLMLLLGLIVPDSPQNSSTEGGGERKESTSTSLTAQKSACTPLEQAVLNGIASGEKEGVGMKPVRGFALKSPDFEKVYFMAIEFEATGIDNQVGVWARNGISEGLILAVDGFAKEFTEWPDAAESSAKIALNDPSVDEVRSCLDD